MKRKLTYIVFALLSLLSFQSCKEEYEVFDELGISSHTLNIAQTPGETHIAVYSTGEWKVRLDTPVDWASLNKLSGEGMGDFVLSWSANYGIARSVKIIVSRGSRKETINVIQSGLVTNPFITLSADRFVLPRQKADFSLSVSTNIAFGLDQFKARAVYYGVGDKRDTLEVGSAEAGAWIKSCNFTEGLVEVSVSANESGEDRTADLVCYITDAAGMETKATLTVVQTAADPVFSISAESETVYSNAQDHIVPSSANNIWSLEGVSASSDAAWLSGLEVVEEGLRFTTAENTSGAERSALITVSWTSPEGLTAGDTFTVKQGYYKLLSFEDLRSRTPGVIHGNLLLEGFIVSDPDSPNVCSSVQTGQFAFDRTENDRTAYFESTDGKYGFCLKFNDASQNSVARWSKALLSLDGLTLERVLSPQRFTISGVKSSNITVEACDPSLVPQKSKTIAQLSDSDIYTYVSLQNVEILSKEGSYTNASEGYCLKDELNPLGTLQPRWDVAPLLCYDEAGDAINILTNAAAPWRRTGNDVQWYSCLPQEAGTLSGIIVSDDVAPVRWGNLGKYQIRPMSAEEIDLNGESFSNTICEWNWNDGKEKITQDVGKGYFYKYDASTKFVNDYNNPYLPTEDLPNGYGNSNLKGLVAGAAISLTQVWWDYEKDEGKYFDVEFSTAGLSGTSLIFGIVWGHGLGDTKTVCAPSHWKVLYSTDGGNTFADLASADIVRQRSCAWWTTTSQDAAPGYTEHLFKLPSSCFGRSKVRVRLQVADLVTDIVPLTSATAWRQALGLEKGFLTATDEGPVRIGTITVRYN